MPRIHDRDCFYKYVTHERALQVLSTRTFRWSAPTTFNDPFDTQTGFACGPDEALRMAAGLSTSIERMVYSDLPFQTETKLAKMLAKLRSARDRFPRKGFLKLTRQASEDLLRDFPAVVAALNQQAKDMLCNSRVFCVSEVTDSVLMWSHYAEEHRGVVLQLGCLPDLDNALCYARPVHYEDGPARMLDDYQLHLTGEKGQMDLAPHIYDLAFRKQAAWFYEKEWRVHYPIVQNELDGEHSLFREQDAVFQGVYLGCRMDEQAKNELIAMTHAEFPFARVFAARKDQGMLVFDEVRQSA